jgi:hypothetical protein
MSEVAFARVEVNGLFWMAIVMASTLSAKDRPMEWKAVQIKHVFSYHFNIAYFMMRVVTKWES